MLIDIGTEWLRHRLIGRTTTMSSRCRLRASPMRGAASRALASRARLPVIAPPIRRSPRRSPIGVRWRVWRLLLGLLVLGHLARCDRPHGAAGSCG